MPIIRFKPLCVKPEHDSDDAARRLLQSLKRSKKGNLWTRFNGGVRADIGLIVTIFRYRRGRYKGLLSWSICDGEHDTRYSEETFKCVDDAATSLAWSLREDYDVEI